MGAVISWLTHVLHGAGAAPIIDLHGSHCAICHWGPDGSTSSKEADTRPASTVGGRKGE